MINIPVKIKKLNPEAVIPRYAKQGDAGFDLVAIEDKIIPPGETAKVRTGLAMAIPEGYELQIRPRSGVSAKTKLRVSNAPGTIDAGYRGEICVLLDNIAQPNPSGVEKGQITFDATFKLITIGGEPTDYKPVGYEEECFYKPTYVIHKGDRIAQGILSAVPVAGFQEVEELDDTERGDGGFGSTGVTNNRL